MPAVDEDHYRWVFRAAVADRLKLLTSTLLRNVRAILRLNQFDVIVVQRELLARIYPVFETWIVRRHGRLVFDFDDLIFSRPPGGSSWWYRTASVAFDKNAGDRIVRMSSRVIAGSNYLKSLALKHNKRVTVIPTVVDTNRWAPSLPNGSEKRPTIVWTGNPSSSYYLESAAGVLTALARTHEFRLLIIGASSSTQSVLQSVPNAEFRTWGLETELSDLLEGDIGIMPIIDDVWSRGKCGLKAIEYMALGIPAVCSPYGANSDIITNGHDGFVVNTTSEWESTLAKLLSDRDLRVRIGQASRTTAVTRFSVEVNAPKLLSLLEETANI
jgi:glycosyltransferase involved in cell wall biosynthesis